MQMISWINNCLVLLLKYCEIKYKIFRENRKKSSSSRSHAIIAAKNADEIRLMSNK